MTKCVFRVDALPFMGVGHLSRSLALAGALRAGGMSVHFVCRDGVGSQYWLVEREGFSLHHLPAAPPPVAPKDPRQWLGVIPEEDAEATIRVIDREIGSVDWLVVDHYAIEYYWERRLRNFCKQILIIDDLADRRHDCDLLLDQSLRDGNPYIGLVPAAAKFLLGPRYALLRPEFARQRARCRVRDGQIRRIVVFFGGSDQTGDTFMALDALIRLSPPLEAEIIVGAMNSSKKAIEVACRPYPFLHFYCQVSDMATRLARADLAIGAGGTTSWERLSMGLPTLVIEQVDNQSENARQLEQYGVAIRLGRSSEVQSDHILASINTLLANPERLREKSARALDLVDGQGACRLAMVMGMRI